MKLLKENELVWSNVVANSNMNRSRKLLGVNSYEKEVGFNILEYLINKLKNDKIIRWVDLCCGEGNALIEASKFLIERNINQIELTGVDLVDMFEIHEPCDILRLEVKPLDDWEPKCKYDLITCIHGLHYIGDKLSIISRAVKLLKNDGQFIANIGLESIKDLSGQSFKSKIVQELKKAQIVYNYRKKTIACVGSRQVNFDLKYLGADDQAGKNYTGQEAVNSYYEKEELS